MAIRTNALAVPGLTVFCLIAGYFVGSSEWGNLSYLTSPDSNQQQALSCPKPFIPPPKRAQIGSLLEQEGMKVGLELGVQKGIFAEETLRQWSGCERYVLVDLWSHQEHYKDLANVDNNAHDNNYLQAMAAVKPFQEKVKIEVCRNFTSVCVDQFEDESFDYIYVDARHDFKGVYEDMVAYWPKLKPGGLYAGHDYVEQRHVGRQVWTENYDGTIDETRTVVRGAVNKFASEIGRQLIVTYEDRMWWTWLMRK